MPDITPDNPDVATVQRFIAASPEAIFDLLADPARHREIDGSGTVRDASGGSQRLQLGSTFGMAMKMGIPYSMVNTVIEFEENRRIAWQPKPAIGFMRRFAGGRIWRYVLEPKDGGTLVSESWDISQEVNPKAVRRLRSRTVQSMDATLERIAHTLSNRT